MNIVEYVDNNRVTWVNNNFLSFFHYLPFKSSDKSTASLSAIATQPESGFKSFVFLLSFCLIIKLCKETSQYICWIQKSCTVMLTVTIVCWCFGAIVFSFFFFFFFRGWGFCWWRQISCDYYRSHWLVVARTLKIHEIEIEG